MGRTPVRINGSFGVGVLVIGVLLGSVEDLVLFAAVALISILLHEAAHVLVMRRYGGTDARIVLHAVGGFAVSVDRIRPRRARVGVYLAGSVATFVLLGLPALLVAARWDDAPGSVDAAITYVVWFNVWLAGFSLLPVLPNDGGRVLYEVLGLVISERTAARAAAAISAVVAMLVGGSVCVALFAGDPLERGFTAQQAVGSLLLLYLAMMLLVYAAVNVTALTRSGTVEVAQDIERAFLALCDGDLAGAEDIVRHSRAHEADLLRRGYVVEILAWVALTRGDRARATRVFERVPTQMANRSLLRMALGHHGPRKKVAGTVRSLRAPLALLPAPVYLSQLEEEGLLSQVATVVLEPGPATASLGRQRFMNALFRAGRFDQAVVFGERLLAVGEEPGLVTYNLACCHCRLGDPETAWTWLDRSFRQEGYGNLTALAEDEDLAPLHRDDRYARLCADLGVVPLSAPSDA